MNECIMLTIDPSTTNTGYAVFKNGRLTKHGRLSPTGEDAQKRTDEMIFLLYGLFVEWSPDICIIEAQTVFNDKYTDSCLSEIIGAVRCLSLLRGTWFDRLYPTEWRKLVADADEAIPMKRNECKPWDITKVGLLFQDDVTKKITDDEADAILIGQAYVNLFGNDSEAEPIESDETICTKNN